MLRLRRPTEDLRQYLLMLLMTLLKNEIYRVNIGVYIYVCVYVGRENLQLCQISYIAGLLYFHWQQTIHFTTFNANYCDFRVIIIILLHFYFIFYDSLALRRRPKL